MILHYKKLTETAHEPTRGSKYAAGYDLYADDSYELSAGETMKIHTGIAIELPHGTFGAIYARSGLATKHGLRPANCVGVIDEDYRGEIIVALHNDSAYVHNIGKGDRVAQLVIQPYMAPYLVEKEELTDTARGDGGFGSTGTSSEASTDASYERYVQMSMFDYINAKEGKDVSDNNG